MTLNTLNFTTRESYIAWRTEWRRSYRKLSRAIRLKRADQKSHQRQNGGRPSAKLESEIYGLQNQAREYLNLRGESKLLAGRLRAERLAQKEAA